MKIKLYNSLKIGLLLSLMAISDFSYALNNLPKNLLLEYEFKLLGIPLGTITKKLSLKNGIYYANSNIYPNLQASLLYKGKLNEESQFKVINGKISPVSFHAVREGYKPYDRRVTFDHKNKQLHYSNGERDPLSINTYDLGSFPFAFMLENIQNLENTHFQINNGKKSHVFIALAPERESLVIPAGTFSSTKIKLVRQNKKDEYFHVWLADETNYPIKIVRNKNGKKSSLQLLSFKDSS